MQAGFYMRVNPAVYRKAAAFGGVGGAVWQVSKRKRLSLLLLLLLIVVVVDVGPVSVRAVVPRADGGVFVIVVLAALVVGSSVVHPVGEVGLQSLREGQSAFSDGRRKKKKKKNRRPPAVTTALPNEAPTNTRLTDTPAAEKVSRETFASPGITKEREAATEKAKAFAAFLWP